jgi:hypothetical protein
MSGTTQTASVLVSIRGRRPHGGFGTACGKLSAVLGWYQTEYRHACNDIQLGSMDGTAAVFIDNALLDPHRDEGLFLQIDRLIDVTRPDPLRVLSTSKAFAAEPGLARELDWPDDQQPIGGRLSADLFFFRRRPIIGPEGHDLLEEALAPAMPMFVTSPNPALDAARYHTQIEFDRTYRTIQREPAYQGKNVLFVAGLNVDVAPRGGLLFPLTKFVPWAAYARLRDGTNFLLEQDALFAGLAEQSVENADQISFDAAIKTMAEVEGIELPSV